MGKKQPKVEQVDYHRNGIGGAGFAVAIVDDPEVGRALVIDFNVDDNDEEHGDYGYTAVLNLDEAHKGNIYMFPDEEHAGNNAWRGDVVGDRLRPLIREALDKKWGMR